MVVDNIGSVQVLGKLMFRMAQHNTYTPQISRLRFPSWSAISKPSISETVFPKPTLYPMFTSLPMASSSAALRCESLSCSCCSATPISSVEHKMSSPAKIFIKGLPLTTSEGRLVKAFSEFGEVSEVKLLMDKEDGQFLGIAYIWFAKEESAQLAVKEMNGKFFNGRFIYVTIAKPGSSKNWRNTAPYRF